MVPDTGKMQKYLEFKKGVREGQGQTVITGITEQLIQTEKDLRAAEDEMLEFQKQNNIGFIQEEGNSAAAYLVKLNRDYAAFKTEYDLLEMLDLDQNLAADDPAEDAVGGEVVITGRHVQRGGVQLAPAGGVADVPATVNELVAHAEMLRPKD